jgi:uncharacterized protein YydD (DUF2326 family)
MIKAVRCDQESFKKVTFEKGFNVVLAQRTKESTEKDSRNGTGKTSLIEIIHFCLGSRIEQKDTLRAKELEDWTFILDLTLRGKEYTIYRNTSNRSNIRIKGDFSDWPIKPLYNDKKNAYMMKARDWTSLLSYMMFDLQMIKDKQYTPTFRSLISYFIRRGVEAFQSPFKHFPQQKEWDIQVNNTYLLGLNWEYAAEFQILKDEGKTLEDLRKAAEQGLLTGFFGSLGELEAERVRLEEKTNESERQVATFKVHPQYYDIEEEMNRLTREIHDITNTYTLNRQILHGYEKSIAEEEDVPIDKVERIYNEAGLTFSDTVIKTLSNIIHFHKKVIENRKDYLQSEITRLSKEIEEQKSQIRSLSNKRSELFTILRTHGALDEYSKLQNRVTDLKQQLEEIKNRIENVKKFEEGKSSLDIKRQSLLQKARRDFEERKAQRDKAISLFNRNSQRLYAEPGILSMDIAEKGYKFNVDIKRAKSQGIGYMKVFFYDLTLMQLRAHYQDMPGFLIHDSTIYDGVDERQIAASMELVAEEAEKGFQYISTINSDCVPYEDFSSNFRDKFNDYTRIELTDEEDGCLFGIRF